MRRLLWMAILKLLLRRASCHVALTTKRRGALWCSEVGSDLCFAQEYIEKAEVDDKRQQRRGGGGGGGGGKEEAAAEVEEEDRD